MLEIMEVYGWDWYTYQSQPSWVISLAFEKMKVQRKLAEANTASIKDGSYGQ